MALTNTPLDRLATLHLAALRAEEKSEKTVELYVRALDLFRTWMSETLGKPATLAALTADNVRRWAGWLAEGDRRGTTTCHMYQQFLKVHTAWLVREGVLSADPLRNLRLPKIKPAEPKILSDDELMRMAACCDRTLQPLRNKAIILLLADTGVRVSGLCGLDVEDLTMPTAKVPQGRIRVVLKGGAEVTLPFGKKAGQALQNYLMLERQRPPEPGEPLLLGRAGERVTVKLVAAMVGEAAKLAGVRDKKTSPHGFRHYAATSWAAAGMNAFEIQHRLGHASLDMSRLYVHLAQRQQEQAYSAVDRLPLRSSRLTRRQLARQLRANPRRQAS